MDGGISKLWKNFGDNLLEFISCQKPHVATLNYDALLYELFVDKGVPSTGVPVCCPPPIRSWSTDCSEQASKKTLC